MNSQQLMNRDDQRAEAINRLSQVATDLELTYSYDENFMTIHLPQPDEVELPIVAKIDVPEEEVNTTIPTSDLISYFARLLHKKYGGDWVCTHAPEAGMIGATFTDGVRTIAVKEGETSSIRDAVYEEISDDKPNA